MKNVVKSHSEPSYTHLVSDSSPEPDFSPDPDLSPEPDPAPEKYTTGTLVSGSLNIKFMKCKKGIKLYR